LLWGLTMPARNRAHYKGTYPRRAAAVRAAAYADPSTRCWRCGRTLAAHPPHTTGAAATWQAGHIVDGDSSQPLLPEASTCNTSAGATYGNTKREPTSRRW
jgi:hypothetical protein